MEVLLLLLLLTYLTTSAFLRSSY